MEAVCDYGFFPNSRGGCTLKTLRLCFLTLLFLPFCLSGVAAQDFSADVEWAVVSEVNLQLAPLDVAISSDGYTLYILTPGQIILHSVPKDITEKEIPVEEGFDMISATRDGLILSSTSTRKVKFIRLENVYTFSESDLPSFGPADAEIVITVFNDYQCPFCKNLKILLDQVMERYQGRAHMVFKNFPLAMHKSARLAATAALAADRQGKFEEMHAKLYENQPLLNAEKINELAEEIGLDMEQFKNDLQDQKIQQIISRDAQEGQRAGVRGTPTIFVNGKRLLNRSLDGFDRLIESRLAKKD
jgi:protein-disulfide isomerase